VPLSQTIHVLVTGDHATVRKNAPCSAGIRPDDTGGEVMTKAERQRPVGPSKYYNETSGR